MRDFFRIESDGDLGTPRVKNLPYWCSYGCFVGDGEWRIICHIPTTSGCEIAVFFAFRPKNVFFLCVSLIFALSCSSLFCHEVLVGYLVAFTNPREIKWNTTTETHDWLPWTLWRKPKLKGASLVKTNSKWKKKHTSPERCRDLAFPSLRLNK